MASERTAAACPDCGGPKGPRSQRCDQCARKQRNPTWLRVSPGSPEAHAQIAGAKKANRAFREQAQENARLAQLARDAGLDKPPPLPKHQETGRDLPTGAQLTGSDPDFTGGLTTQEFMDKIRGNRDGHE